MHHFFGHFLRYQPTLVPFCPIFSYIPKIGHPTLANIPTYPNILYERSLNNYLLLPKYFQDESDSDEPEIIAEYEHEQIIEDVKTAPETAQAQDSSSSSSDSESENVEKEIVSEENLMETIESFQKSNLKTVETVVKASLPDQAQ